MAFLGEGNGMLHVAKLDLDAPRLLDTHQLCIGQIPQRRTKFLELAHASVGGVDYEEHGEGMGMAMSKRLAAEFLGTFWLVLGGCGSAVLAAHFGGDGNPLGIGLVGVSLAFGLTVLTMAYAVGHISGGHFNPAVSLGLWAAGRFSTKDLGPYILIQVLGGLAAGVVLYLIATGKAGAEVGGFASNGYGERSPGGYGLGAAFLTEVVMTLFFLVVILGVTSKAAPAGFAPIAIGLCLTLIHLISIPVTNTSVNPARSTGVAFFADAGAVPQLWLFWLAPIIGALIAGYLTRWLQSTSDSASPALKPAVVPNT